MDPNHGRADERGRHHSPGSCVGLWIACLAFLGCGSSNGGGSGAADGGGEGTASLTVSPQTATTTLGGSDINLAATLSGSSNPITWTLNGPGRISPAAGSTTAYTPPPFGGSPLTAAVTATAGTGISASATIQIVVPASINVIGRVIDSSRRPVPGVVIRIGGTTTVSASDGSFRIGNVPVPYDLTAVAIAPKKLGVAYQGLTRPDPTVMMLGPSTSQVHGVLTGNVTGGDPLAIAGERTAVFFASPETPGYFFNDGNVTYVPSNPYTLDVGWPGPSPITGTVHALQWRSDGGLPVAYPAYGSTPGVTVSDGGTATADLIMTAPPVSSISGSIQMGSEFMYFQQSLYIVFPGSAVLLGVDLASSGTFRYPFPDVSGGTAMLVTSANYQGSNVSGVQLSGITPGTTNLVVEIRKPPTPVVPADHATGIGVTTDFGWTEMPGTTYELSISGPGSSPSFYVFTSATSGRIPDLTMHGLGLPAATKYTWIVNTFGPSSGVDDLAGPSSLYQFWDNSYFTGTAYPRDFTTP